MIRIITSLFATLTICATIQAQTVYYGTFSGMLGTRSSYFGYQAGMISTPGSTDNSFFGFSSGRLNTGSQNSGFGASALYFNTTGAANAATGFESMYSNTTGSYNTSNGYHTLRSNTTGKNNTVIGSYGMYANTEGNENTATGSFALYVNTIGYGNTASGMRSLASNTDGSFNTANGAYSLRANTTGIWNTATGGASLYNNTSGSNNVAVGIDAGYANLNGNGNTSAGFQALYNNASGSYNSAFGHSAGPKSPTLEGTTAIGYGATPMASYTVRIGNPSVTSIGGFVGWSNLSDGRFKRNIKEDVAGLDFVNQLRPVSYEIDKTALYRFLNIPDSVSQSSNAKVAPVRQTGFIAQDVEAVVKKSGYVFTGIETPQNDSDHYSIRYADFVVPLVKAVQELTAKLNEQEQKSEEQGLEIAALKEKLGVSGGSDFNANDTRAALYQNTPNPFSSETEIKMTLPETTRQAHVVLYNLEGKQLKDFQVYDRGKASIRVSSNEFSAGMYLYALIVDGNVVDTKRLILTK